MARSVQGETPFDPDLAEIGVIVPEFVGDRLVWRPAPVPVPPPLAPRRGLVPTIWHAVVGVLVGLWRFLAGSPAAAVRPHRSLAEAAAWTPYLLAAGAVSEAAHRAGVTMEEAARALEAACGPIPNRAVSLTQGGVTVHFADPPLPTRPNPCVPERR